MRELNAQDLADISRGSAVLASGGGGDPYLGSLAALQALEEFGAPTLIEASELSDDATVTCSALFGAPLPFVEKLTLGVELEAAYRALTGRLGRPIDALMPIEAGGVNMMIPMLMGARLGLPVVDADLMGRAFPELTLVTLTLYDISVCPTALADEHGNTVIVDAVDNHWADRLCRAAAIQFGATAGECTAPISAAQVRRAAVHGSVTHAQRIGRAIREAHETKDDPIERLLTATRGHRLFSGKIVDVQRRTEQSSTFGEVVIEGFGDTAGSRVTVQFRNENLVARLDTGELLAMVPDIITIIDAETGQAITTERLQYGFRVMVLGIAIDDKWRSPRGIEVAGPRHFGYDLDYVPVEDLMKVL